MPWLGRLFWVQGVAGERRLHDQKGDAVAVTTALKLEEQRRKFEDRRGALIGKFYRVRAKMGKWCI